MHGLLTPLCSLLINLQSLLLLTRIDSMHLFFLYRVLHHPAGLALMARQARHLLRAPKHEGKPKIFCIAYLHSYSTFSLLEMQ